MLTIRFRRTGKKGQPSYRIVVAPEGAPLYGKYIEMIGHYNPFTKVIVLDNKKAEEWMVKGAHPTNSVAKIFVKSGLKHKSIVVKKYRAVSKKELETQKAQDEAEKTKIAAEKEAQKAAFDEQVAEEKAAQPSSEEKLQQQADESIKEIKEEEQVKAEEKTETQTVAQDKKDEEKDTKSEEKSK